MTSNRIGAFASLLESRLRTAQHTREVITAMKDEDMHYGSSSEQGDAILAQAKLVLFNPKKDYINLHPQQAAIDLARCFPSLKKKLSRDASWEDFLHCGDSHGENLAVAFVLSVYDAANPFDVHRALQVWDPAHREVFLAWASDPWWI